MMSFPDHFSSVAGGYARFRPGYPPSLFAWLAGVAPRRRRAWDCGTGPGRAVSGLTRHFEQVVATEASLAQLARGVRGTELPTDVAGRTVFVNSLAERPALAARSVDLVTVAQAVHWFDLDAFWPEVHRVLGPGGVVAIWGYGLLTVEPDPGGRVDAVLQRFAHEVVGSHWPPQRRRVEDRYRSLPFPFEELPVPQIDSEAEWTREHLLGYLGTWSATRRYREAEGEDPRRRIEGELAALWPGSEGRRVRWRLFLRVGRGGRV